MRAFAATAMLIASVLAGGHLPHDDQQGLISPKPDMDHHMDHHDMDMDHGMGDYDKMHRLEEMIEKFCDGLDEKMHDDKHSDSDHDMDHDKDHDKDHDDEKHRMLAGHGDHDESDEKDDHDMWDMMGMGEESDDDSDHDGKRRERGERDHGHVKDMWLCMQAKQMAWDLKEYMHGDEHDKIRQSRGWMKDIHEMKREWGMDGASNLAMAGAAMIVAVSALSF